MKIFKHILEKTMERATQKHYWVYVVVRTIFLSGCMTMIVDSQTIDCIPHKKAILMAFFVFSAVIFLIFQALALSEVRSRVDLESKYGPRKEKSFFTFVDEVFSKEK